MLEISEDDILDRMRVDNPWWKTGQVAIVSGYKKRAYFESFAEEAMQTAFRRAVVLMGPRRVGKTVLIHQLITDLISSGHPAHELLYLSMDAPIYNRLPLERAVQIFLNSQIGKQSAKPIVCFDEIQVVKNWEGQLKVLVDSYPAVRFVASGSAAGALKMKSAESGAGRFTDYLLPPLTFAEYLDLLGVENDVVEKISKFSYRSIDLTALNQHFVKYINLGGYPEIALSNDSVESLAKRLGSDIIEKVLLRDLPSLYGIGDVTELNALFTTLAYNTGQEVSLENLSQGSSVSKNTLKRYLDYLEAAFLIKRVARIDQTGKKFTRATFFKVYLTSPSMRAALFGPVDETDLAMGALVETAIFCQWFHSSELKNLRFARWDKSNDGEVDIVGLGAQQKPEWCVEVKWTDRFYERPHRLKSLSLFLQKNQQIHTVMCTTKTKSGKGQLQGREIGFLPSSEYCYMLGKNILTRQRVAGGYKDKDVQPNFFD